MNPYLKTIEDIILQNNRLTEQDKQSLLITLAEADKQWNITEFKFDRTEKVKKTMAILLEETIEELEQKRKDLEVQNRELEIETALERVRTVAMGMSKPDDMLKVCRMISDQLQQLGFKEIRNVQTAIIYEEKFEYLNYQYFTPYDKNSIERIDYRLHPEVLKFSETMLQSPDAYYTKTFEGEELDVWRQYRKETAQMPDPKLDEVSSSHYYFYSIGSGALGVTTYTPLTEDQVNLFKRFRNVFQLAYSRFTDIQKAEEQSREVQIELALEKVRSHAMAMQTSDELNLLIGTVFTELTKLDLELTRCVILIYEGAEKGFRWWMANSEVPSMPMNFFVKYADLPFFNAYLEGWHKRKLKWQYILEGDNKIATDDFLFTETELSQLPDFVVAGMRAPERVYLNASFNNFGNLTLASLAPLSDEHFDILLRFAKVFDLTYTRFNDLKQAEAQAREAKIETALEKVRGRSLAMHKSEELQEVVNTVFERLQELDIEMDSANIAIFKEGSRDFDYWVASDFQKRAASFHMPYSELLLTKDLIAARESGTDYSAKAYSLEDKNEWFNYAFSNTDFKFLTDERKQFILNAPAITVSIAFSKYTGVQVIRYSTKLLCEGEIEIVKRFSKVFEQAYVRFLDLQKAEAQARESQIEAALERVRSRTMAMHKSTELLDVINEVSDQLVHLNFRFDNVSLGINNKDYDIDFWMAAKGQPRPLEIHSPYIDNPLVNRIKEARQKGLDFFSDICTPQENREWIRHTIRSAGKEIFSEQTKAFLLSSPGYSRSTILMENINFFIGNYAAYPYSDEENAIFRRFANVIGQSYTRFLDLKKAEAQAKEAQVELSLERIRSKVMAMQESSELLDIVVAMRSEFVALGHEAHYFWHMRWLPDKYEKAMTSGDGTRIGMVMQLPRYIHGDIKQLAEWEKGNEPTVVFAMDAETAVDYVHKMITLGHFEQVDHNAPTLDDIRHIGGLTFIMSRTTHGEIGYSLPGHVLDPPAEGMATLNRFASVFDLAYKRFEDLKTAEKDLIAIKAARLKAEEALADLQFTQKQLIQSEKMASLGELTAGIAHEIQNPLNFVNNFSEVSNELIDEMMQEVAKGNYEEARAIAEDVKQNLQKIHHHGQRADGIVKGMLQHSRTGSSQKELVDINVLADEYLRLSYHGLRAKDKSFNATFETGFDPTVEKINVVPQEIGRVILNLINNAFYAVSEKKKQQPDGYEPTISVTTQRVDDKVVLRVSDNGNGIPQKVLDKIFQPFFTTKPTGKGTGLGLSLSYDIIKAHGGVLSVETKEGEETNFFVTIPVQ